MNTGIQRINEAVQQASAFVRPLFTEIGQSHRRPDLSGRAAGHRPARQRPRPARRRPGPGQDALRQNRWPTASTSNSPACSLRRTCCPADVIGTQIYNPQSGGFTTRQGSDLRQPRPGRRNQPRPGQGAKRPAGSDAGKASHHWRSDVQAGRAVPRAGHAKSHRAGRHLSAARSPGRSLHAEAENCLSDRARKNGRSWI